MGDTATGSWTANQLGGYIREMEADKELREKMKTHDCPYREGLRWMIHEVASVLGNWQYSIAHGYFTEEVQKKGLKRLQEAEDFGISQYKDPK